MEQHQRDDNEPDVLGKRQGRDWQAASEAFL